MLDRRSFLRGLSASAPLFALPGAARAQRGARPRLHAMVVGIDRYSGRVRRGPIPPLLGCINDATDIAGQVARLGPGSLRVLGIDNAPVTRATFFSAWADMVAAAAEGDTLLLTYSGHGGQVPERCSGNEADGLDETLVLSQFDVGQTRATAEHILDDELAERFAAAAAKRLLVVFVADSCYSGTVYRAVDSVAKVRYRTVRAYDLAPGDLAPGDASPAACAATPPRDPPNLLFLAAAQEDEVVPEINVGGQWRGALSFAMARALEGRAARDGVITAHGLSQFVLAYVQSLADAGQHPNVTWPSRTRATPNDVMTIAGDTPVIVLDQNAPSPRLAAAPADGIETGPVRLRIAGMADAEQRGVVSSLHNVVLVGEGEAAALIWDARRLLILNDQGHRIAEDVDAGQLQHAIDRRRALERLIDMSVGSAVTVRIRLRDEPADAPPSATSDATHTTGTILYIDVAGIADGAFFTVFNLTGNGKVELIAPAPAQERCDSADCGRGARKAVGVSIGPIEVLVRPPYGAEHVVAVAGTLPLSRLMPTLAQSHGRLAVAEVMAALAAELRTQPLQAGFRGIYSARE